MSPISPRRRRHFGSLERRIRVPPLPRLDDKSEDTMTPTTPLVPVRARRPAVCLSALQDVSDAFEGSDDLFAERCEDDVPASRTLDLHGVGLG